jgi:hypothetical protein
VTSSVAKWRRTRSPAFLARSRPGWPITASISGPVCTHREPLPNGLGKDRITGPALWQLPAVAPVTVLVVAALTTIPARLGTRRPTAEILQAELA